MHVTIIVCFMSVGSQKWVSIEQGSETAPVLKLGQIRSFLLLNDESIEVKFATREYAIGSLLRAKFCHDKLTQWMQKPHSSKFDETGSFFTCGIDPCTGDGLGLDSGFLPYRGDTCVSWCLTKSQGPD